MKKKNPLPLMNEGVGELRVSKTLFYLIGNCVAFPIKQKALRGMRTRAKKKYVASDRARRENVPRHILFYLTEMSRRPIC